MAHDIKYTNALQNSNARTQLHVFAPHTMRATNEEVEGKARECVCLLFL